VWFITKSTMIRMPRACAASINAAKSAMVPTSGITPV